MPSTDHNIVYIAAHIVNNSEYYMHTKKLAINDIETTIAAIFIEANNIIWCQK